MRLKLLEPAEVDKAVEALAFFRVSVGGVLDAGARRDLCRKAVAAENPVIVLALDGDTCVGIVVAIIDPLRFWKRFALTHPLLALRRLAKRASPGGAVAAAMRPGAALRTAGLESPGAPDGRWNDPSPRSARILIIAVRPDCQGRGVGKRMFSRLFTELRQRGIARLYSRIEGDNTASLRLHAASGYSLYPDGDVVLAIRNLADEGAVQERTEHC